MAVRYLKVIADPLKFYAAKTRFWEQKLLPLKQKEDLPAALEVSEVHVSHFDASQLKSSVTHFPSLFGQECSDRC